jgi:starvation-inducible DNA-binding protein
MSFEREKRAYLSASPEQRAVAQASLSRILGMLRAMYLSYQTSHWQVRGPTFYGDHLLFQRLYESVAVQIDQIAEKVVGYFGPDGVGLASQGQLIQYSMERWNQEADHVLRGLQSEEDLQVLLQESYDAIKEAGAMTLGLDDWIMATANAHEENQYLLQQVVAPSKQVQASGKSLEDEIAALKAQVKRLEESGLGFHKKLLPRVQQRLRDLQRQLVRERNDRSRQQEQAGRANAKQKAELLARLIKKHGGPDRLSVWHKPGVGTRIYWPGDLGFLSIGQDGSVSGLNRGRYTFDEFSLYKGWRRAYRAALAEYTRSLEMS